MRQITLFLFLVSFTTIAQVGDQLFSDFESGTLEGWTNSDGTTILLTLEDISDPLAGQEGNKILQKICDGTETSVGEMAIIKVFPEPLILNHEGFGCFCGMRFLIRNQNDFDIALRVGFRDSQGRRIVFNIVANIPVVPSFSDWVPYGEVIFAEPDYLDGAFAFDFSQVVEVKIFHNDNPTPSYDGLFVEGILEIDEITPVILLGIEDTNRFNIILSPNPTQNHLVITATTPISDYRIYDLSGKFVREGLINNTQYEMDTSFLSSGMYLIELTSDQGKEVRKIIKN